MNKAIARAVIKRDRATCVLCGGLYHHLHHVQYKSLGGDDIEKNLVCLCHTCHLKVHGDSEYWKPKLIGLLQLHYGTIKIEDLKKKGKYHDFRY